MKQFTNAEKTAKIIRANGNEQYFLILFLKITGTNKPDKNTAANTYLNMPPQK